MIFGYYKIWYLRRYNWNAAEKPNKLIMGEDADKDAVPRKSRVFNRVLDVLVMSFTMKALMYMTKCPSSCNWNKE